MAPVATFAEQRPRLLRIAQRMLGSLHEAEDVLQDAFVRWHETDSEGVRSPEAFLVTMVSRLALDRLRRAKTERAAYVGQWLPEPWMHGAPADEAPDARELQKGELSYAALVLLSQLSPEERAAFLLREVFELDYAAIAEAVERSEAATRKLVQRAHEHLQEKAPRMQASAEQRRDLLARFQAACEASDAQALTAILAPNARYVSDGGGKVFAARDVIVGAERIVRLQMTLPKKRPAGTQYGERLVTVDGEPALLTLLDDAVIAISFVEVEDGVIRDMYRILNPDKLQAVSERVAAGAL